MTVSQANEANQEKNDVEFILNDIGGAFGKFQIYNYIMLSFSMFISGLYIFDYVFSTLEIDHRCRISECDQIEQSTFNPDWLQYSTPFNQNGHPDPCHRYGKIYNEDATDNGCDIDSFNRSVIINCANGPMVFSTDEISIVNEFDLICDENRWKIAIVGTLSSVGRMIFLPIIGYFSDRIGRKNVLIGSTLISSVIKVLKSFAVDYNLFVALEMLDAGINGAIYPTALIMGMELATVEYSILVNCIILFFYPLGQIVTALIASYLHDYKWLLRVISIFGFATIPYIWTLRESLRWLMVNRKYEKTVNVIERAAKMNDVNISSQTYAIVAKKCKNENDATTNPNLDGSFIDIILSCCLLTRLIILACLWIGCVFLTYGVSIMSVSMQGDKYINFIVVSFGGIVGLFLTYFMLKYMSRRWSMLISLFITGVSILASKFFHNDPNISLILFFVAKLFVNHAFTYLYVYTNELWPTVLRHRIMGFCSMVGRIGMLLAPLVPLLITVMEMLPTYLFSGIAFLSAVIILFLPETFKQTKLPDSISDIKKFKDSK